VLVLAPNWLGDAVMATPFLFMLRRALPERSVFLLCRSYVAPIYRHCSAVDHLAVYERRSGIRGALRAVREHVPGRAREICFVLPVSFRSALIAVLSGTGRRMGYGGDFRRALLTDALPSGAYRSGHLVEAYGALVELATGRAAGKAPLPVVVPSYEWEKDIDAFGLEEGYVVISPGAEYGGAKVWPAERFARVASLLARRMGRRLVVVGSSAEAERGGEILSGAGIGTGLNLAGKCSVDELLSVLRGASLVVGNDSGPAHIAAAMGRPTVAIFGSTSPAWTGPRGSAVEIISSGVDCSPCFERECPKGEALCLERIEPEEVVERACGLAGEVCRDGAN